jgi:phage N-6-adenine-methyltransferase
VVEEILMANIKGTQTSNSDLWETPDWLFGALDREFHFTLDAAAMPENAKCEKFFTEEDDGLSQSWAGHTVWLNPPYSENKLWIRKAFESAACGDATVVILIPARTDTKFWWEFVRHGEVRFLPGRLKFKLPEQESSNRKADSAPFPSAVVIFRRNLLNYPNLQQTIYWNIREIK